MVYAVIDTNILVSARISKNPLAATVKVVANVFRSSSLATSSIFQELLK